MEFPPTVLKYTGRQLGQVGVNVCAWCPPMDWHSPHLVACATGIGSRLHHDLDHDQAVSESE